MSVECFLLLTIILVKSAGFPEQLYDPHAAALFCMEI